MEELVRDGWYGMAYCRGQCYKVWHIPFMSDHVCRTGVLCNSVVKAKKTGIFQICATGKSDGNGE